MYSISKAAINSFTRCWAKELAKDGVSFNAISPGSIDTEILNKAKMPFEEINKYKKKVRKGIPWERFGKPEEMANMSLFLVSNEGSYVNSSIYSIDGAGTFQYI